MKYEGTYAEPPDGRAPGPAPPSFPEPRESGKTRYRTIFLSDIHLGTKGCQADRLTAFLKAHDCETLYLVGDIIDGWRLKSTFYWPQAHNNVLRRVFTLMKRGTRVVFVTGNHDEFLRKYSDMEVGHLSLVDQAVHETADGRKLLVVHGDQFDVITRYHRWLAFLGDVGYNLLLRLNRYLNAARAHFERVVQLTNGDHLLAKVMFAESYARLVFDRELHDGLLRDVLAADPRAPGLTLMNTIAKEQAQALLESADDYF